MPVAFWLVKTMFTAAVVSIALVTCAFALAVPKRSGRVADISPTCELVAFLFMMVTMLELLNVLVSDKS